MSLSAKKNLPIGIFDSGMGGLTVLKALQQALPNENFIYLGDTARLPYGTKSAQTVRAYALNANELLVQEGIKALVLACNTATGPALGALQDKYPDLPIIGVIQPGVKAALSQARPTGPIVILATESTVKGGAYPTQIAMISPERETIAWPCSLLVPLSEEGWCEGALVEQIVAKILSPLLAHLKDQTPACVVLGCTHFPVFKTVIQKVLGDAVQVIDPAKTVAQELMAVLQARHLSNDALTPGTARFMATDGIDRFVRVAPIFLGNAITPKAIKLVTVAITTPLITELPGLSASGDEQTHQEAQG